MRDLAPAATDRPIGYFVHHQGRGHAVRAAAVANALPSSRPVTLFCARDDVFPLLRRGVTVCTLPSLFERRGDEATGMDWVPTPQTAHCAPLGWPGIRTAMATLAGWFQAADPVLMISDVSAEVAQLARLCSVPHVAVLQHGDRSDPGHRAAYDGAAGLLAPFARALAQPDWPAEMLAKTCFAGGLGAEADMPPRSEARRRLGLGPDTPLAVALSGGGGSGMAAAPLGIAARTFPQMQWVSLGEVQRDWHATEPANLNHLGWVDGAVDWIAAADLVVASTGNTTCQQILTAGVPWIAVPEWRYFDEQVAKARALAAAGAALHLPHLPSSAHAWRDAVAAARAAHDPTRQHALCDAAPAAIAARWLETLIDRLWSETAAAPALEDPHAAS
ncbi:hypothetical protein DXV76_18800 [Rhodobacteraceae bacterium CCMM004]|nr:hypothetical protein DXV76_18800 [Rhodobacteraceae bacterium CCMM004]